jgi:Tol biopolymer transport system component
VLFPEGTLWRSKIDGSDTLQLAGSSPQPILPRWSPDGKTIAYCTLPTASDEAVHIEFVSRDGGAPRQLTAGDYRSQCDPSWSPDGSSLAFGATTSAPSGIHILHVASGEVTTLPGSNRFFSPRWSPDGRYIACQTSDEKSLRLFDLKTLRWSTLVTSTLAGFPNWSKDGKYLYFMTADSVMRVRINDHKVEQVFPWHDIKQTGYWGGGWFGLAPDGSIMFLKDASTIEIVAMDFKEP